MTEAKRYHLTETGLVEGESLGRLSVVLSSDFDTLQSRLDDTERQRRAEFDAGQAAERLVAALQQRLTAADERVDAAIALVTRMIECAGGQPSIATGYLRDILGALKPAEGLDRRDMAAKVHLMKREGGDEHCS